MAARMMMTDPALMDPELPQGMAAPDMVQHPMHAMIAPISAPVPEVDPMVQYEQGMAAKPAPEAKMSLGGENEPGKVTKMSPMDATESRDQGRLMADYAKDENPWGTPGNHPGFLGKLGHLGSQFIQNIQHGQGQLTPREAEEAKLEKGVQGIESEKSKEGLEGAQAGLAGATQAHTEAETPEVAPNAESTRVLQGAQAGHLEAETAGLENPQPDYEVHDTAEGPMVVNKKTGVGQHLAVNGLPVGPKVQTKTVPLEIGGKPHQVLVNDADGTVIKDLGESGEKPPTVRVETPGEERGAKNDLLKAYQPTLDSAERMNVMTESYEKAVKDHDQQAMLNLLANHLGMTMGLQKGARMTKDIIHEAQQSQPWLQGLQAKFDKDGYLSGVTLSPNQMRQMVALGQSRYTEDAKKSRSTAQYLGAKDDGPKRDPNDSTQRYYLSISGNDPKRARDAMLKDGWTF